MAFSIRFFHARKKKKVVAFVSLVCWSGVGWGSCRSTGGTIRDLSHKRRKIPETKQILCSNKVNPANKRTTRKEKRGGGEPRPPRDDRLEVGARGGKKQQLQIRHRQHIRLPAHKVPRRSEQVSHEKDMFRVKYGAEISPTFRREH